ncbi:MAG TPA: DUF98 domain-containing protein [Thiotrichales bacterium]|nr:DUF98 domain-containing protein [Thiotrichales bacterium]
MQNINLQPGKFTIRMSHKSYFRSSGYVSEHIITTDSGETLNLAELPPFLRTLLVADGTVTKALEAWFWEPVKIAPLHNKLEQLTATIEGLEAGKGDRVLQREVALKGKNTDRVYACARSTVSLKHLPEKICTALEAGRIGIGELLREQGFETYRDIFNINYLPEIPAEDSLLSLLSSEIISRSYRIRVSGNPAIIVTEYFPVQLHRK